jgi:hypothetical protein
MWLVSRLGIEHVLGLVKLVLLEGRILLFSCRASMASCAVLALLTLIPGLYNQVRQREWAMMRLGLFKLGVSVRRCIGVSRRIDSPLEGSHARQS